MKITLEITIADWRDVPVNDWDKRKRILQRIASEAASHADLRAERLGVVAHIRTTTEVQP